MDYMETHTPGGSCKAPAPGSRCYMPQDQTCDLTLAHCSLLHAQPFLESYRSRAQVPQARACSVDHKPGLIAVSCPVAPQDSEVTFEMHPASTLVVLANLMLCCNLAGSQAGAATAAEAEG